MVRSILQIGNPILTKKSKTITDYNSKETKQVIQDLLDTCMANKAITAGLAAPQIGSNVRICVCRRVDLEEEKGRGIVNDNELWEVLINPEVIDKSDKDSLVWEACLSVGEGDNRINGPVFRPGWAKAKYITRDGKKKEIEGEGFLSHLIQHEIDHLEGILFLKYVKNPANLWKNKDLDLYLSEFDEYPPIK